MYQHLKTVSQEADTNSDIIAEDFLSNKMESSTFLQTYLRERKVGVVDHTPLYIYN